LGERHWNVTNVRRPKVRRMVPTEHQTDGLRLEPTGLEVGADG
jgi:hypothetical protein